MDESDTEEKKRREQEDEEDRLPPLEIPNFELHLLDGDLKDFEERDRRIIMEIRRMSKMVGFAIATLIKLYKFNRRVDHRVRKVEAAQQPGLKVRRWAKVVLGLIALNILIPLIHEFVKNALFSKGP